MNDLITAIAPHVPLRPDVRHVPIDEARAKMGSLAEVLSLDQVVRSPRARALGWTPGVRSVALAVQHPLSRGFASSFLIVGDEQRSRSFAELPLRVVSPDYFETTGVPLKRGRLLQPADRAGAPLVVVINEEAARRYFQNLDPIGKQIRFWGQPREIVGIVGNEHFYGLNEPPPPAAYPSILQAPSGYASILIRAQKRAFLSTLMHRAVQGYRDRGVAANFRGSIPGRLRRSVLALH